MDGEQGKWESPSLARRPCCQETVEKPHPKTVIPIHWDNFFLPLAGPAKGMPFFIEDTKTVFYRQARYCESGAIDCLIQIPGTSIEA